MTDIFRSRVNGNVVAEAQRDPAAFRSGVADALVQGGEALGAVANQDARLKQDVADSEARIAKVERDRSRSAMVADRMGAWPDVQVDVSNKLDDLRNSADPGAPDYQQRVDDIVGQGLKAFKDSLGDDPEVVERFAPLMATFGASTKQGERRWAVANKTKAEGANVDKWADSASNQLLTNPTPENYEAQMGAVDDLIDALDAPPAVRAAIKDQKKAAFTHAFLDGRMQAGDWQGVRALLNKGTLDAYLGNDGRDKAGYLRQIDNAEAVDARRAELAQSAIRDQARDAVKAVEAKVRAGIVPTPAELRAVEAGARKAGLDPAELIDFQALSVRANTNRLYVGQDPAVMRRDRDALAAKMTAGTATEAEQVMRKQLDDLVDDADEKVAAGLRDMVAQGPKGTLQALGSLRGTPDARYAQAEKLGAGLGGIALLGPVVQRAAIEGRDLRKARPKDFGDPKDVEAAAQAALGPTVMATLGGNYRNAVNAAWDIMASNQARFGRSGFEPGEFRLALQSYLGATRRPTGQLQGGVQQVRGSAVWLPSWQTAGEFDAQLSRLPFADAVYGNGKPADKADVLTNYRPAYIGEGADGNVLYHMLDASGRPLAHKNGSAYVVFVRHPR